MHNEKGPGVNEITNNGLYLKRNCSGKTGHSGPENWRIIITLDQLWEFFKNFAEWKIWGNVIFLAFRPFFTVWLGMVKLSQASVNWILKQSGRDLFHHYNWILKTVRTWLGCLNSEDMICQVNIYVMDIVWILCVMFMCGGQNSWFCKASLRICYVSLFECKGPWVLKTVINCHLWNRGLQN